MDKVSGFRDYLKRLYSEAAEYNADNLADRYVNTFNDKYINGVYDKADAVLDTIGGIPEYAVDKVLRYIKPNLAGKSVSDRIQEKLRKSIEDRIAGQADKANTLTSWFEKGIKTVPSLVADEINKLNNVNRAKGKIGDIVNSRLGMTEDKIKKSFNGAYKNLLKGSWYKDPRNALRAYALSTNNPFLTKMTNDPKLFWGATAGIVGLPLLIALMRRRNPQQPQYFPTGPYYGGAYPIQPTPSNVFWRQ